MNLKVDRTYGDIGKIYGHDDIVDWFEEIKECNLSNKLPESGFLPQEVHVHNIERVFNNNHRIIICGNVTDEYYNVMKWLDTLSKEELNIFDMYSIEVDEELKEIHVYFKVY